MDTTKTCPGCGEPVPPSLGKKPRIYCSKKCMKQAWKAANHEKVIYQGHKWRTANHENELDMDRARRAANPEKTIEQRRARYAANPKKYIQFTRAWCAANPEKVNEKNRASREKLSAAYIASLLRLPVSLIPKQYIEAKRSQLKLKRELKEKK